MPKRVFTVSPMPPEKCAYALARYSRSPDSIGQSMEWVRTHDSQEFLESFYFQYGHASIADLGHAVLCFEGISELAATEIEDEQLWDGQARSSRYQDFSRSGVVVPPDLNGPQVALYQEATGKLLKAYQDIHTRMTDHLTERLPRPEGMKPEVYKRNIAARAFDVARYVLFFGIPTGVGQVTSIRTLERQIRRLKASPYLEVRELATEIAEACAAEPTCQWEPGVTVEPLAPTLARHVEADGHLQQSQIDLARWAEQNLPPPAAGAVMVVDLCRPNDALGEIAATLLYPVTDRPFRELLDIAGSWSNARKREVIDTAMQSRSRRDELLRNFRTATYAFDIVMDIGAYRDLHRHRRCQQFRQTYTMALGFETPQGLIDAGVAPEYMKLLTEIRELWSGLAGPAAHYMLPFAARSRFLFKMDFAEAEYICRLRSGVKGHVSYRTIAWEMKQKLGELEPELANLLEATPPWTEDPLTR